MERDLASPCSAQVVDWCLDHGIPEPRLIPPSAQTRSLSASFSLCPFQHLSEVFQKSFRFLGALGLVIGLPSRQTKVAREINLLNIDIKRKCVWFETLKSFEISVAVNAALSADQAEQEETAQIELCRRCAEPEVHAPLEN